MASGRGLTEEQARESCLGEAVELASACFWGNEPLLRAAWREVEDRAIDPAHLVLVSEEQYRERAAWNRAYSAFDWLPVPFDRSRQTDWVEATSPDGSDSALIPADCAYIGYSEAGDELAPAIADSNGCAAGATRDEAIVAAFLELVERDAVSIWWYGRHRRPAFGPVALAGAETLLASLGARRRTFHLLDLTTDFGIPVCAAVSAEPGGDLVAVGTAAHFDADRAAVAALTEMLQTELSIGLRVREPLDDGDGFGNWIRHVSFRTMPHLLASPHAPPPVRRNIPPEVASCTRLCREAGLRLLVIDLTRPEFGIPVVRVVVPGMRPLRRRLAPGRLFDVPVSLGWRRRKTSSSRINPVSMSG
jgi:ribosomal protein S12 methylthiotransferase accessory factor